MLSRASSKCHILSQTLSMSVLASVCVKNQTVPSPRRDSCDSVLVRQLQQVLCRFSIVPVTPEFKKWQRVLTVA